MVFFSLEEEEKSNISRVRNYNLKRELEMHTVQGIRKFTRATRATLFAMQSRLRAFMFAQHSGLCARENARFE